MRFTVAADQFCRERPILAIGLYLAVSLALALAQSTVDDIGFGAFIILSTVLGPITYLSMIFTHSSGLDGAVICVLGSFYLGFSMFSVLFLRLALQREREVEIRLRFRNAGVIVWVCAGFFSFLSRTG